MTSAWLGAARPGIVAAVVSCVGALGVATCGGKAEIDPGDLGLPGTGGVGGTTGTATATTDTSSTDTSTATSSTSDTTTTTGTITGTTTTTTSTTTSSSSSSSSFGGSVGGCTSSSQCVAPGECCISIMACTTLDGVCAQESSGTCVEDC